ncbi:MAG: DNA polymerase, partial [Oscillospiraceae bacterium]
YNALKNSFANARLILQVHDELIVQCDEKDSAAIANLLKEQMENAVNLDVPLKADVSVGKTWYDAKN